MNSDLVDDFVVQGYGWIVRWIDVDGAYFNGPGPANTFTVYFYSDNDGLSRQPGLRNFRAVDAEREHLHCTCMRQSSLRRPAVPISRQILGRDPSNMTAMCCGEWGWTDRTVTKP